MLTPQRRRQNLWIDTPAGFIGGASYWPTGLAPDPTAVLLVPGIAHEEQRMNGGLVALAEALANAGLPSLLIDLHGCAKGAGRLDEPDIGECWRADIRAAVAYLRECGAARVIVVGARLGLLLAADALAEEPLAALVGWAPIASGKRYLRELKVMQRDRDREASSPGTIAIAGFSIPPVVTAHVASLDLARIDLSATPRMLLRVAVEDVDAEWLAALQPAGTALERQGSARIRPWLFGGEDHPDLPQDDVVALTEWCRALHEGATTGQGPQPRRPGQRRAIEFLHNGRAVRETFVEVGPHRMTGVLSEPVEAGEDHAARLLMTTAGPGRMFTEFARDEASRGNVSLRFDFAGFGTSGRGEAPQGGAYYVDCGADDVRDAIGWLREAGHARIYAFGYCAGAWAMLMADPPPELRAVAALNVALYREPGAELPSLARSLRQRLVSVLPAFVRQPLRRGIAAHVRRAAARRSKPVEWLLRLCNAGVGVMLAYAEDDPGLDYLRGQMRKRGHAGLRRSFVLNVYAGLDHLVGGSSARARVFADIAAFFAHVDRESAGAARLAAAMPIATRSNKKPRRDLQGGLLGKRGAGTAWIRDESTVGGASARH